MTPLCFDISGRCVESGARAGRITTVHGSFDTPAFMPVGTKGSIKGILPNLVRDAGAQIVLNNTYHMLLRPGPELVRDMGGVHRFMNWHGPILTDSGGYQAFSLADTNSVDDEGVTFKSIVDGSRIRLTPERAVEVQNMLGADIIMAFDDCPPSAPPTDAMTTGLTGDESGEDPRLRRAVVRDAGHRGYDHEARLDVALERTTRWLERCKRAHDASAERSLFGIVQGGTDLARRSRSVEQVCNVDLPGYAIGGVAVGESSSDIARVVRHTAPLLPVEKPRYLMGVGYERDIVAAVRAGIDMFDCVLPTRNGRNANAFTREGQIRLRNAKFAVDEGPIEAGCDCAACDPLNHGWSGTFSRGYIRHLFMSGEMLGPILVTLHNLRHYQRLMLDIRSAIRDGAWGNFIKRWPVASPGYAPC